MRVTRLNAPLCGLPLTAATLPLFKRYSIAAQTNG
jgi:hypothetical protein